MCNIIMYNHKKQKAYGIERLLQTFLLKNIRKHVTSIFPYEIFDSRSINRLRNLFFNLKSFTKVW